MRSPAKPVKSALIRDLKTLVATDSVSTVSSAPIARKVAALMKRSGFKVTFQREIYDKKIHVNVVGVKGSGKNALLLCSHMDTVPPGDLAKWTKTGGDPWNAVASGGRVYGLGSADDKGPLVSMIHAGASWRHEELKRPLIVLATYGEERGMGGARMFVRRWKDPRPDAAFVGEPTALGITYRHKGMGVLTVILHTRLKAPIGKRTQKVFTGKQGHSSRPWTGDNALNKAARFLREEAGRFPGAALLSLTGGFAANLIPDRGEAVLAAFGPAKRRGVPGFRKRGGVPGFPCASVADCFESVQELLSRHAGQKDRLLVPPTVTSNFAIAETQGASLSLTFDFRLLPGQRIIAFSREFRKILAPRLAGHAGISFEIRIERDNPPLGLTAKHALVRTGCGVLKRKGLPVRVETKPSCTEAGIYLDWGVPAVIFGPGVAAGNIHSPNESIEVSQMEKAFRFYDALIRERCAGEAV